MSDLAEEVAALRKRIEALEAMEARVRTYIKELQRQARTPGFRRGLTPVEEDT